MLCKKIFIRREELSFFVTLQKPIKLNIAFKYDFKCYSETNFGHMEYIFDLDRQYTSSLGEKVGNYRVYPLHAYKFNHSWN